MNQLLEYKKKFANNQDQEGDDEHPKATPQRNRRVNLLRF